MECYIIRIYHRDRKDPQMVAGMVEETGKAGKKGFLGLIPCGKYCPPLR